MYRSLVIYIVVVCLSGTALFAQSEGRVSPFRRVLSKFTFGFSTGYGRTYYNHKPVDFLAGSSTNSGMYLFENAGSVGDSIQIFSNWINDVTASGHVVTSSDFSVGADTTDLKMKGKGYSVPFSGFIFFSYDRYRLGGGYTVEFHDVGKFTPNQYFDELGEMDPEIKLTTWTRWYGLFGVRVFDIYDWEFIVDGHFGKLKMGRQFNQTLIEQGMYFNLGITAEYSFSEYFKAFVRPNYEYKNYVLTVSETGTSITHQQPALYFNFGVTYRIPELPKCPVQQCRTQLNHIHKHTGKEYRSKVHPFWKKQNPNYGENYKNLIKYKWKNKRKLNAY